MQITLAQLADLPAIAALVNSGYRGEVSRAGWTTEADLFEGERTNPESLAANLAGGPGRMMLVLRLSATEKPTGCVYLQAGYGPDGLGCYLGMLTVSPTAQASGLGRALMAAAESKARELGATDMHLCVLNPRAELMAWYERRGYTRTGETKPFPYAEKAKAERPTRDDLHFIYFSKKL